MFTFDYTAIILVLINIFVIGLFTFLAFYLFRLYQIHSRQEEKVVKEKAFVKAMQLIDQAQSKSVQIVQDANLKSQQIIQDSTHISEESKSQLLNELKQVTQEQKSLIQDNLNSTMGEFLAVLEEEKKANQKTLQNFSSAIEEEKKAGLDSMSGITNKFDQTVQSELDEFTNILEQQTIKSEKEVQQRLDNEYARIHKELEDYEERKKQEIVTKINSILIRVTKDVLGKSISPELGEELVLKALEDSKVQGEV